jgi:hypothetical protein
MDRKHEGDFSRRWREDEMTRSLTISPNPPEWFEPGRILTEYLEGKRTAEIAESLGVTRERLSYYLLALAEEDWRAAQLQRAIRRMEDAEQEIDEAQDMIQLNKANAKLRSAQWTLERLCRRIYGESPPPSQAQALQVVINLRRDSGRTLEAQAGATASDPEPAQPQKELSDGNA